MLHLTGKHKNNKDEEKQDITPTSVDIYQIFQEPYKTELNSCSAQPSIKYEIYFSSESIKLI